MIVFDSQGKIVLPDHLLNLQFRYSDEDLVGQPVEQYENMFQLFKRLHGQDKLVGGAGWGLTIAK